MTPARWSRVAPIVESALMRDGPAREAFVAAACGDDVALRSEVDSLLVRASDSDDALNRAVTDAVHDASGRRPLAGDRIGQYAIGGRLGAGGMGEVYRARDTGLDRLVAVKMLPSIFTADEERVARLQREARMLAALNHPGIGAIYGLERIDGAPVLILELVEGPTLAERLAHGPLPIAEALSVAMAIAEALAAAHDRGIIHRDIKPANIKCTPGGVVKVLDFGLAKDVAHIGTDGAVPASSVESPLDLSHAGTVLGTVAYMAPEQARGEAIDARADLYSLGAVLYEMVTGRPAFAGGEALRIRDAGPDRVQRSPRLVNPAVPRSLERIILRLMAPSRDARYRSAADVYVDLARAAGVEADHRSRSPAARRLRRAMIAFPLAAAAALVAWTWSSRSPSAPARDEYTQITHFADSATSPALSQDGRLLTFIRGNSTFEGRGQIYVKALPSGDPVPLTADASEKMGPVFSPDGSHVAYTSVSGRFVWDTWIVPVAERTPRFWLRNASGLTWLRDGRLLYSEITSGLHMRVVSADAARGAARVLYSPEGDRGMAHRSYVSPDGAWLLVVEMIQPVWQPCRLVAVESRTSRRVGPDGQCTGAAWSPDGRWMYFSSNRSGRSHIWRQRFPDGVPEQITVGPGEEDGIAVEADGRSLLTSIGTRQSSVWVRDATGEREVSREGYAFIPAIPNAGTSQPFARDGRLLYLVRQGSVRFTGPGERAGELWLADLRTSASDALLPGVRVTGFQVSRDGSQIVFAALDDGGASHVWIAPTDRRSAPRQLSTLEAESPHFGANGAIYFRSAEGFVYRLGADGDSQRVIARPVVFLMSVSPDDAWIVARVASAAGMDSSQENIAFPTTPGRPAVRLCGGSTCEIDWTPDARSLVVRTSAIGSPPRSRTFVVALRAGETLPPLPSDGIESESDLAALRITRVVDGFVYPADAAPTVAFVRTTTTRNIYRVPLRP